MTPISNALDVTDKMKKSQVSRVSVSAIVTYEDDDGNPRNAFEHGEVVARIEFDDGDVLLARLEAA